MTVIREFILKKSGRPRFKLEFSFNGKRRYMTLSCPTMSDAQTFATFLERVIGQVRLGNALDPVSDAWVKQLPACTRDRLAEFGILPPQAQPPTLERVIELLIEERGISPAGEAARKPTHDSLKSHFGPMLPITVVHQAGAHGWWKSISAGIHSQATLAKRLKDAKAVFNFAVRKGFIQSNPLAGTRGGSQRNIKRQKFLTWPEVDEVIQAANATGQRAFVELGVLLALARLAGMRIPSEARTLTWADVDLDLQRLTIRNAKLGSGGCKESFRDCPMSGELREMLQRFKPPDADPGDLVFPRGRGGAINAPWSTLRRLFERISHPGWVKPFPNLRGSYVSELRRNGISRASVSRWAGHSITTADTYYDLPFEDEFLLATRPNRVRYPQSPPTRAA